MNRGRPRTDPVVFRRPGAAGCRTGTPGSSRDRSGAGRFRLRGLTLCLLALLGYSLVLSARAEWQIYHLRRELAAAQQLRQSLLERRRALEEERRKLSDPSYIEDVAREELGLVKPGEVLIVPGDRLSQP